MNDEQHSEEYLLKARNIKHARNIKKKLHKKSFFGFEIAVKYSPELESADDTLKKLLYFQVKTQPKFTTNLEAAPIKRRKI
jgi:uncharacterized protein YggL (DUF469 family)